MQTFTTEDLSTRQGLISDLFAVPQDSAEWDKYRLSDEQVAHFQAFGYVAGVKTLEPHQVERLKEELGPITDPAHPGNGLFHEFHSNESTDPNTVLFHALGAWRITPGFHDVLWNPSFVMAASQLLGGSVRFWHDQLFCKPARHGGVVAWHQDYSYWTRTRPMAHLTCWTGLDDADTQNGCMYYVPGSHRWGLLDKPALAGDMEGIMGYLSEDQKREFKPVPIELKAGYSAFHHPLLLHGSYANRTDRSRRAFVLNVFRDGVQSDADEPLLAGVPVITKGKPMGGRFFPLLFPPSA
jgi:hypothetical protein